MESKLGFHPPPMFLRRYLLGGFFFVTKALRGGDDLRPRLLPDVDRDQRAPAPFEHALRVRARHHTRVAVPGWGEHGVEHGIGQIAVFTVVGGLEYLDRPQAAEWHIIK